MRNIPSPFQEPDSILLLGLAILLLSATRDVSRHCYNTTHNWKKSGHPVKDVLDVL